MDKQNSKCGFCKRGKEVENICGKLWFNEKVKCCAHHRCMQYSALLVQYQMKKFGGFKVQKVLKEIHRGRSLKCFICFNNKKIKEKPITGATSGCAISHCKKTFHFYCARTNPETCTQKIESRDAGEDSFKILYRVFCTKEHKDEFCTQLKEYNFALDSDIEEYNATSESDSDDESSSKDVDKNSHNSNINNKNNVKNKIINSPLVNTDSETEIFKYSNIHSNDNQMVSIKKPKLNIDLSEDLVYIICFLESASIPNGKSMQILKKCAWKLFGVQGEYVFLWQYEGVALTPLHVIYILYYISLALSSDNEDELFRLMTKLNDKDIDKISDLIASTLTEENNADLSAKLRRQISDHFVAGKSNKEKLVSKYCLVNNLEEKYVGFIVLNNQSDSRKHIRKAFGANFEMPKKSGCICWLSTNSLSKSTGEVLDAVLECRILFDWLVEKNVVYRNLHHFPMDELLISSNNLLVINKLKRRVELELENSSDGSEIIFIHPTKSGILNFSVYAKLRIEKCVEELLTFQHDVIIIVDISSTCVTNTSDLLFECRPEIQCTAYIAAEATTRNLNCAILHYCLQ